jgi:hypothetical protein
VKIRGYLSKPEDTHDYQSLGNTRLCEKQIANVRQFGVVSDDLLLS